ncbi:hypothetical protein C922_02339 [Plasmodium inui San Antonio 1]|uniref:Uncharacterized protein n=1 Tax=Plasmodium inui San Antonio 1 TaxID=1237626 RepID=W7ADP8_9APIC|nr:hypothetical protein C922_02339 [Plasmodium inui San Antonio 1]EUD67189.1 hypothetical protein C922_02339 [Plasmodium inui San Antonio 1]
MLKRALAENTGGCNHPPQKARSKSVSIFSFFKKKKKEKSNSNESVISTSNDSFELPPGQGNKKERNGEGGREKQNMMDEESATENRKAKFKNNTTNTAHSEYTQNYKECQVMKNSHLKKKRESFFQKINILQKFRNYKKRNATGTFHAGHNASSASANDEDREEETSNLDKKGSCADVDYTKMYTSLKRKNNNNSNKSYSIEDEINSLKHKAQMLRNNIYFNGKKKADKGKLIHKHLNCSSEIIRNADERDSSSCEVNSLLTNFKMKSNKLKCDEGDSVDQMGNSGRVQKVEREYIFDRSSDVEVWDEGGLSDQGKSVQGHNTDEQQGLNSNSNVIDFNEYLYGEKREDEAYLTESRGAESGTSEGKVSRNVDGSREGSKLGRRSKRDGCHNGDRNMDRSVWHTQEELKRTSEFSFSSFSKSKGELVRNVQSKINDNGRTINNYVMYSNNRGGANLKPHSRTEATTTQEGEKLTSREIITISQYDKQTTNEDIHKGCTISKGHNDDHHEQGKNALECIPIDREENLAQKEIIIKLMYNNNGIYFNQDDNGTGGVPSARANTAKVPSYDKVNSRVYGSKSVNVSRSGSTILHPLRQQGTYEKMTNQKNGNNEFVNVSNEDAHKKFSSPEASRGYYWGGKSQGSVPRGDTHSLGNPQNKCSNGNEKGEKEKKKHQNGTTDEGIEEGKKDNIINKYLLDPLYNLFVQPKEEADDPHLRNNNISLPPPRAGRNYTSELQKTYRALYDIYDGSYAGGVQHKAHPKTDGSMNVVDRSFSRNGDGNTGVTSPVESTGIPLDNQIDGSRIYMCPLSRSKSMNKENAPPFEHIQKEAYNLSVKDTHHGYLNKASLYDTHFNTFHLKKKRREPTFRRGGNGNFLSMSGLANCYNSPIKNMCTFLEHNFVRGSYYPRQECLASKFKGRSYTSCKGNQGCSGSPIGGQQSGIMKKSCTFHGYQNDLHKDGQPYGYRGTPPAMTPVVTPMVNPVMTPIVTGMEKPKIIPVTPPKEHTLHNCGTYCPDVGGKSHPPVNQNCNANNVVNSFVRNANPVMFPQRNPINVGSSFPSKWVANNWRQTSTNVGHAEQVSRGGPYAQNNKQVRSKNMRNCTPFQCMTYGDGRPSSSRNDYMSRNFYTPVERLKNEKLRRLQSYSSKSKPPVCLSKSEGHGEIQPNMFHGDKNGGVMKRAMSLNPARSSSAHLAALDIYQECYVQNEGAHGGAHGGVNGNRNDNNLGGSHNYMDSCRVDGAHTRDATSSTGSSSCDKKILEHEGIEPPFIGRHSSVNDGGNAPRGICQLRENKLTFFRSSSSNDTIRENYPIEGPKFEGKDKMDYPPVSHSNNDDDIELYAVSLEQDGENSVSEVDHENGEAVTFDKDLYANFTNEEAHQRNDKSGHQSSIEKVVSCDGNWDTPSVYFTYEGEEPLWTVHNSNVKNNPFEDQYSCENGTNISDFLAEKRPEKINDHPIPTVMRHNFWRKEERRSGNSLPSPVEDYLQSYANYSEEKKILNGKVKETKWTHSSDDKENDSASYARTKCDGGPKTEEALHKQNYNPEGRNIKLKKLTNKKTSPKGKVNPNSSNSKIRPSDKRTCEEMTKKKGVVKKVSTALGTSLKRKKKDPPSGAPNGSKMIRQVIPMGEAPPSVSPSKRKKIEPTSKSSNGAHGCETAKHYNIVNTVEESVQVNYNIGENKINYRKESIVSSSNAVCSVNKLEDEAMKMRTTKRVGQIKNRNKDKNPRRGETYSSTSIQREDCNFVGSFSNRYDPLWADGTFVGSFSSMSIKRENCSIEKRYAYLGEPPSDGNGAPRVGSFSRRTARARDGVKKVKKIKKKNRNFSEEKQEKKATTISSTCVQVKKNESAEKKKKKKRKNTSTKRRSELAIDFASTGEENSRVRREPLWGPKENTEKEREREKGNSVNALIKSNRMMLQMESANSNSMLKERLYDEKGDLLNSERDTYISRKTDMAQTSPKDTFYEQVKQMNHILSNKNNSHFLNRINLNHLIAIEKTFINTNVYINKQVITLSTRSTKGGTTKRGSSPHDGILYDDNFSIVYLEQDIIYLKKIFLKKILSILLSHASSFREIKITILLLYFFVSLEEGRVISPSLYPLSLINSLIQKFNLKVRKKLKRGGEVEGPPPNSFASVAADGYYHKAGAQSDASKKGPFDCLFICDGKNYLCVNDNSLPGKTCRTKIKLNNLIGYYHYINLNRLTYYLERASSACGRETK